MGEREGGRKRGRRGGRRMEKGKRNIERRESKLKDEIINEINKVQQLYSNPCP